MGSDDYKAMSREEQLQQTAEEWADYYKHAEDLCDYISIRVAYKEGAAWADEHPANVWHDASEEPQGNNWKILCQDEENGCWVENRTDAIDLHNTWNEYVEIEMVVKWAYISDLLPK